jgi:hypothetical protein
MIFSRSLGDRRWLINAEANGDKALRRNVAFTSILIFGGGAFSQMIYLLVGLIAMTQPGHNDGHPNYAQITTSSMFLVLSIVSATLSGVIYNRRTDAVRHVVDEYIRRDHV